MFDFLDPEEQRLREYAQEAKHLIYEEFKSQTVEYTVIEQKILEKTMLKKSQIIKHVLKPMITDGKLEKHNDAGKVNFTKDNYTFI